METIKNHKRSFTSFLPVLLLISFVNFINILARIIFAPMTPHLSEQLGLSHADMGNLFLILSFGFSLTLFLSQFISARISHKMTVTLSVIAMGVTLLFSSLAQDLSTFKNSLLFLGLASGFFVPSGVAILRQEIQMEHLGKGFGVFATSQSAAFILAPIGIQYLIKFFSYQQILWGFGLFSIGFGFLFFFLIKQGNQKGEPISFAFMKEVFSWPSFWILLTLHFVINGLNIGIYSMAPDYFVQHSLLKEESVNQLIVIARGISIFTAILAGYIADRLGLKRSLVIFLVFCGILTSLMGTSEPSSSLFLFSFQSSLAACLVPLIHFAIATIVPPEKNATIVSLIAPFGFALGAGVIPQILGLFGDFNFYAEGFILFGAVAIISGIVFNMSAVYKHVQVSQESSQASNLET